MHLQTEASLKQYNSLALNAACHVLVCVHDLAQLRESLAWAREAALGVTVLGEGSNVVLAGDLPGLVLVQQSLGIDVLEDAGEQVLVRVAAGENWHQLVTWSLQQGFFGLENLALIPGTAGAAPIQNIGAYGVELSPFVDAVHALRIADSEAVTLSHTQCQFAYRDSAFKHDLRDQLVITAIDLRLSKVAKLQTDYPALANELPQIDGCALTPQDVYDAVVAIRRSKLPDPAVEPNAGSFFKNPVLEKSKAEALTSAYPGLPGYPQAGGRIKFPAAWLIDFCGWKGHRDKGVGVHPEHALVLVNYGSDTGADLLQLADQIAVSVADTFGIALEMEPRVYGRVDG